MQKYVEISDGMMEPTALECYEDCGYFDNEFAIPFSIVWINHIDMYQETYIELVKNQQTEENSEVNYSDIDEFLLNVIKENHYEYLLDKIRNNYNIDEFIHDFSMTHCNLIGQNPLKFFKNILKICCSSEKNYFVSIQTAYWRNSITIKTMNDLLHDIEIAFPDKEYLHEIISHFDNLHFQSNGVEIFLNVIVNKILQIVLNESPFKRIADWYTWTTKILFKLDHCIDNFGDFTNELEIIRLACQYYSLIENKINSTEYQPYQTIVQFNNLIED